MTKPIATKSKPTPKPTTINGRLTLIANEWRETAAGYRQQSGSIASADKLEQWANDLDRIIPTKTNEQRETIEYDHTMTPLKRGRTLPVKPSHRRPTNVKKPA